MSNTHIIIDKGTPQVVGLPLDFITGTDETSCSEDVDQFIAKCNPDWGWTEAKKREVFALAMAEIHPPAPEAPKAPKKSAASNGNSSANLPEAPTNP